MLLLSSMRGRLSMLVKSLSKNLRIGARNNFKTLSFRLFLYFEQNIGAACLTWLENSSSNGFQSIGVENGVNERFWLSWLLEGKWKRRIYWLFYLVEF